MSDSTTNTHGSTQGNTRAQRASSRQSLIQKLQDPIKFVKFFWPHVTLYNKQAEVMYAVRDVPEVFVPAGNMLGKDFVAGLTALWFFLTRQPCRVVTTSADYSQLEAVLWGEIRRFIQTSAVPLDFARGGPLVVNHLHLRKVVGWGQYDKLPTGRLVQKPVQICGISYMVGRVAAKGEGMLGHHVADIGDGIPRTLFIADEASGVEDVSYERADTWARRKLIIGNPYPGAPGCTFFKKGVQGGDVIATDDPNERVRKVDHWDSNEDASQEG